MANDADDLGRYRRDEMTPAERNAFEKRAMNDPFLRDALEGAESVSPDEFARNVSELNRRLGQKKQTQYFTSIRIAAGVAILVSVGWLVYRTTSTTTAPEQSAALAADSTARMDSISNLLTLAAPQKDSAGGADGKNLARSTTESPTTKPLESRPAATLPAPASTAGQSASGAVARTEPPKTEPVSTELAKTEPVKKEPAKTENLVVATQAEEADAAKRDDKVTEKESPAPAGAKRRLAVSEQPQPAARKAEVSRAFADDKGLTGPEIIVIPDDSTATSDPVQLAAPAIGIDAYGRYLEENHRIPAAARTARVRGKVTVTFEVTATGSLSGLRVLKSLGYGCDEELVRLIRNGPAWLPTMHDGPQSSTVWVTLEFIADR